MRTINRLLLVMILGLVVFIGYQATSGWNALTGWIDASLPTFHSGDSTIVHTPDHLLAISIQGEGQQITGATISVVDTVFYNRERAQGHFDNEPDFYEKRLYRGDATLCVSTATVQVESRPDVILFVFPDQEICFASIKNEVVVETTEWNRAMPTDTAEFYRQEMRDLAQKRLWLPSSFLQKDREELRERSITEIHKTLSDLLGPIMSQHGDNRPIEVSIPAL